MPGNEEVLELAGIKRARALVAAPCNGYGKCVRGAHSQATQSRHLYYGPGS